jgi:heme oxygenase (mycobilin-producing)
MIQVMVGYKLKEGVNIEHIFRKIRSNSMNYPGFMGAQNLQNTRDPSIVALVTTWENMEAWRNWEQSSIRQEIVAEAKPLVAEELRVSIYNIVPTVSWRS